MLEQVVRSLPCDPGDFVRMIDVSVKANLLSQIPAVLRKADQGLRPRVTFLNPTWGDSKTLRCESDPLNVAHAKQSDTFSH